MAVMDEFREERESIKTAPARVKWQYFKDYYLMWVLGGLALVIVVVSFIVSILRQKDTVFYAALVNLSPRETAESAVTETFSGQSLEDPRHQQIVVDTSIRLQALSEEPGEEEEFDPASVTDVKYSYEDEEKLTVLVMTGSVDLLVTGQDVFEKYIPAGWYTDLREVLDEETLAAYEEADRLLYDRTVPVGVRMDEAELLTRQYVYAGEGEPSLYAGIIAGSQHADMAAEFLKFLE